MRIHCATPPAIAALSFSIFALAVPVSAQLAPTSPFLPANAVISSTTAPAESTAIELHGVVPTPNGPLFSIYNVASKKSTYVGLNEQGFWGSTAAGGTFVVRTYTQLGDQDQVTIEYQGRTQTVSTKSPKVAVAGRGGAANAGAAAPGGAVNAVPAGRGGGPGGGGGQGGGGPVGGGAQGGGRGGGGAGGAPGGGFAGAGGAGGGGRGGAPGGGFAGAGGAAGGGAGADAAAATPISANQAATLADAVAKQQQARANALANPTLVTTPASPVAPAAGGGGRGGRGGN